MNLITDAKGFFTLWGMLGDESIVGGVLFVCYLAVFILGLFKRMWMSSIYRGVVLLLLALIPVFFCVGFYFISRPPA
jgi:hypothetical protein